AHGLYKALLGPVRDIIKDKRLIVVPSGPLASLPFNVLVIELPDASGARLSSQARDSRASSGLGARVALPCPAALKCSESALTQHQPAAVIPETLAQYREVAWIGARSAITVLPSVASLKALRQFARKSHATKAYIGIGNPLLDGPQDDPILGAYYRERAA